MAVDTSFKLRVLYQGTFVEGRQVALVDTHLAPHLVAWLYKAVTDAIVDTVIADEDGERTIGVPTIFIFCGNSNSKFFTSVIIQDLMPVVNIEVQSFIALAMKTVSLIISNNSIYEQGFLVCHAEIERGNVHWYSDIHIVGIYLWM